MEKEINGIVLNRMYSGEYLRENLGHEVINLYQADNGNHYLYLCSVGSFKKERKGTIKHMIMVKKHQPNFYQIVGIAKNLTDTIEEKNELMFKYRSQKEFHQEGKESVCYGGVNVFEIFDQNKEHQDICITYKAEKVFIPKKDKKILLCYNNACCQKNNENTEIFYINAYSKKFRDKNFIMPNEKNKEKQKDYETLLSIIENKDLWEECKKFELSNFRLNEENDMHKEFKERINNLKNKKK